MYNGPYCVVIDAEIFVDKEITHASNVSPRDFRMCFFESVRDHIGSFADNLDILHDTVISQDITLKFLS